MVCGGLRQAVGMDGEPSLERGRAAAPASGTQLAEKKKTIDNRGRGPLDRGTQGALGAQGGTCEGGEGAKTENVDGTEMEAWRGKGIVNTETVTGTMIGSPTGIDPGMGARCGRTSGGVQPDGAAVALGMEPPTSGAQPRCGTTSALPVGQASFGSDVDRRPDSPGAKGQGSADAPAALAAVRCELSLGGPP